MPVQYNQRTAMECDFSNGKPVSGQWQNPMKLHLVIPNKPQSSPFDQLPKTPVAARLRQDYADYSAELPWIPIAATG